ncbi:MAG: glycosyl transferase, WecB/TagA/CpsF family [Sphingobacteriaceae bacterium]|jgi:N-acetylglucosaminyldiphosphoundecaprenol N-acetyl-beta-D-mannosaminyltransferase|nr:glycosyl transferase, WecB/TagA/CpsF family [Sphingobacteriaceae bacterium]
MNTLSANFLEYNVYADSLSQLPSKPPLLVNTINQYSYCVAEKDQRFKEALLGSDVLLPDGVAVVAATKLLSGKKIKKIAGADIHEFLLKDLNEKGGSCFYLGASEKTLSIIKSKLAEQFPNVRVGSYSPPYKPEFSSDENGQMIAAVNNFSPDVLFVGMTAPKQEKWAFAHKSELNTKIICTIGAVFDFFAGTVDRPAKIWINIGLEWFVRLVKEPKRLWRRYLYYGPIFVGLMLKEKIKKIGQPSKDSALGG